MKYFYALAIFTKPINHLLTRINFLYLLTHEELNQCLSQKAGPAVAMWAGAPLNFEAAAQYKCVRSL